MRKLVWIVTLACGAATADDARSVLEQAAKTIGNPRTIQYSGSGAIFTVGQNPSATAPWPRVEVKNFTRTLDYESQSGKNEGIGPQGPTPAAFLSGDKAWGQTASGNINPAPPAVAAERQLQMWLTPHGFLGAAQAGSATVKSRKVGGQKLTEVTVNHGKHRLIGTIAADGTVTEVRSWLDNPVLGDMPVVTTYSDYRDFDGIKFPTKMVQKQGDFPAFDLSVTQVRANVPVNITVPDAVRQATPPVVKVPAEKLADGVWYLTGGSHHSVAIEFRDHVVVIEAPLNEERSAAVIAEVKRSIPNKAIRYLVNTHHHFDHSGGLRTYVAEGATIVTHQSNVPFYQRTLKAERKLNPDRLSRERKKPKFVAVGALHKLSDGTRTVEIHHIQGNPHNEGILMAYLPAERLLVEVDVYSPAPPNAPPSSTPNPASVNLHDNIARLKLDVDRIVPLHGRVVTLADLRKAIGR